MRHGLLGQFVIEAVELIQAGGKRCHHVAAFLLLTVNVVAQGVIKHRLKLVALMLCDLALRQELPRGECDASRSGGYRMSNVAASVRACLLTIAKTQGVDFNQVLVRFGRC